MKISYTPNGVILVNKVHLTKTLIRDLPDMIGIEILKVHNTNVIIRDLATRLWYYISIPKNKSWSNIQFRQFDAYPVKLTIIKGICYLINLNRKSTIEVL